MITFIIYIWCEVLHFHITWPGFCIFHHNINLLLFPANMDSISNRIVCKMWKRSSYLKWRKHPTRFNLITSVRKKGQLSEEVKIGQKNCNEMENMRNGQKPTSGSRPSSRKNDELEAIVDESASFQLRSECGNHTTKQMLDQDVFGKVRQN